MSEAQKIALKILKVNASNIYAYSKENHIILQFQKMSKKPWKKQINQLISMTIKFIIATVRAITFLKVPFIWFANVLSSVILNLTSVIFMSISKKKIKILAMFVQYTSAKNKWKNSACTWKILQNRDLFYYIQEVMGHLFPR